MTATRRTEKHPLEPFLPEGAKLLMLGSFPPPRARWTMDFYYPNFQNDMWRIFGLVFFNDREHFVAESRKAFDEGLIRNFLAEKGIALYDTAAEIVRQKGNASDRFLEIVKPLDLGKILSRIPHCGTLAATGQKAAETLMPIAGIGHVPPLCEYAETDFCGRRLRCYRMPSSSRAYPCALADKAASYRVLFAAAGLL